MDSRYLNCVSASELVSWKIDDLLPMNYVFTFDRPFMPASLTLEHELCFLSPSERLDLNHIRGASYINLFAFVEEYIAALMVQMSSRNSFGKNEKLRAYLRFSEEEVKHQMLFLRFVEMFNQSFRTRCEFLSGADDIANIILSNTELSVLMFTYHLEYISQLHFMSSKKEADSLDPLFVNILKKHWLEESQHALLDFYEIQDVSKALSPDELITATKEYFGILDALVELLKKQAGYNAISLQACAGRVFTNSEIKELKRILWKSSLKNFVLSGLTNLTVRSCFIDLDSRIEELLENKVKSLIDLTCENKNAS